MPGAFGTADEADAEGGRARRARHRRASTWWPTVTTAEPYVVGDGPPPRASPTTSASSARSCATSAGSATVEVVPASTPAADVLARDPTACSSPTAPATPPRSATPSTPSRELLGEVPVFGICLGHQLLAPALGGATYKLPVRPPRRQPPGAPPGHRRGRDHQPEPQLRGGRGLARRRADVTHVNLNDGVIEGMRVPRRAGVQRAVPPRGRPRAPRRRATCSTHFDELMDHGAPS